MTTQHRPWATPFLRWAGSKRGLLPLLSSCIPKEYGTYFEPFVGSACLFFAIRPAAGVLGDFNPDLIATYDTIRRHPRRVARGMQKFGSTADDYYAARALDPSTMPDVDRAARFVFLNRHCFNGVYRTNRKGEFNVPFGSRIGPGPTERDFYRCSVALRAATFVPDDFGVTLRDAVRGDIAYLDPPYSTSTRPSFGEYGYGAFSKADEARLVEQLTELDRRGVAVLFSYADDDAVIDALREWSVVKIGVQRRIGGIGGRRTTTSEILASNVVDVADAMSRSRGGVSSSQASCA
jgi:DNA adenine methylase